MNHRQAGLRRHRSGERALPGPSHPDDENATADSPSWTFHQVQCPNSSTFAHANPRQYFGISNGQGALNALYPRSMEFADLPLEKSQQELLGELVEADERVEDGRRQFLVIGTADSNILAHPKMEKREIDTGDVRTLAECGLIRHVPTSGTTPNYEVRPVGRQYVTWWKQQAGSPIAQVEAEVRRFLDSETFRLHHPAAYEHWAEAVKDVWEADSLAKLTGIGHACRESLELFVTDLVVARQPGDVNQDPQATVDRLRAVMSTVTLSKSVGDVLLAYFGTVWDLVQRQEHGGQKEGEALQQEDARRVVFQTALVMFELDRALGRS